MSAGEKGLGIVLELDEPAVGDGDALNVATEVTELPVSFNVELGDRVLGCWSPAVSRMTPPTTADWTHAHSDSSR